MAISLASSQPYEHVTHTCRSGEIIVRFTIDNFESHHPGHASQIAVMRTYDDTFSGEKIYPGKVCQFVMTQLQSAAPTLLPSLSGRNNGLRYWLLMCSERC